MGEGAPVTCKGRIRMADLNIQTENSRAACQPVLPCMTEYMARNEYWAEAPDVVGELFCRAESGEAWAQYSAGRLCYEGVIVPPNDEGAEKWWKLAAEQEHAKAQWRLGELYASRHTRGETDKEMGSHSAARDIEQARLWLEKAALQGVVEAMGMRGSLETAHGDAIQWYRMGAEHGDMDCMYASGEICLENRGEAANRQEAIKWFRSAAEQGHKGAPYVLGRIFEEGEGVDKDLEVAARYYRMGAEKDHNGCQYLLGKMLIEGRGVPVDYEEADHWLQRVHHDVYDAWELRKRIGFLDRELKKYDDRKLEECAEQIERLMPEAEKGVVAAQFELGELYRHHDVRRQAVEWHWKAASQGHVDSKSALLEIFIDCWYSNSCFEEVKKWVRELAHSGNARAQYLMAHCEDRYDEDGNYSQIYKYWMAKSAELGYPEAQYEYSVARGIYDEEAFNLCLNSAAAGQVNAQIWVAKCYFGGKGTPVNLDAALEWAERAVKSAKDQGKYFELSEAQTMLGNVYEAFQTTQCDLAAVACYIDAAKKFSTEASYGLGRMYEAGRGVEQDQAKAAGYYMEALRHELGLERNREICFLQLYRSIKWHSDKDLEICKQDAERGNSNAQVEYGIRIYDWGRWDPENDAEVARWFRLSADQGNPVGQYCLGRTICSTSRSWGHPVAMQMFRNAARCGLAEAQTAIAQYYRERADYAVAVRWYKMAAEQGEYAALVAMGEMSFKGEGVSQDNVAATKWLRRVLEWSEEAWAKRTWSLLRQTSCGRGA